MVCPSEEEIGEDGLENETNATGTADVDLRGERCGGL
jgi:hypothetical protein